MEIRISIILESSKLMQYAKEAHNDPNFYKKLRHNEGALQLLLPPSIDSLRFRFDSDIHSLICSRAICAWHGMAVPRSIIIDRSSLKSSHSMHASIDH